MNNFYQIIAKPGVGKNRTKYGIRELPMVFQNKKTGKKHIVMVFTTAHWKKELEKEGLWTPYGMPETLKIKS